MGIRVRCDSGGRPDEIRRKRWNAVIASAQDLPPGESPGDTAPALHFGESQTGWDRVRRRVTNGTRTRDFQDHNPALCQLSYGHQQNRAGATPRPGENDRRSSGEGNCVAADPVADAQTGPEPVSSHRRCRACVQARSADEGPRNKGVTNGARTRDSRAHNPALYQLSYGHHQIGVGTSPHPLTGEMIATQRRWTHQVPFAYPG